MTFPDRFAPLSKLAPCHPGRSAATIRGPGRQRRWNGSSMTEHDTRTVLSRRPRRRTAYAEGPVPWKTGRRLGVSAAGRDDSSESALPPKRFPARQDRVQEAADGEVGDAPGPVVPADHLGRPADAQVEEGHPQHRRGHDQAGVEIADRAVRLDAQAATVHLPADAELRPATVPLVRRALDGDRPASEKRKERLLFAANFRLRRCS